MLPRPDGAAGPVITIMTLLATTVALLPCPQSEADAVLATRALSSGATLNVRSQSLVGCMMREKQFCVRLEKRQAIVLAGSDILATLEGNKLTIFDKGQVVAGLASRDWSRGRLNQPRELVRFITYVAASHHPKFSSPHIGRTAWATSLLEVRPLETQRDWDHNWEYLGRRFLDRVRREKAWQGTLIEVDGSPSKLKRIVHIEGYASGGGIGGGESLSWVATLN